MKWVRFRKNGAELFGVQDQDQITVTSLQWPQVLSGLLPDAKGRIHLEEVQLLSPVSRPGKIVAIGQNYLDHCREQNVTPPARPLIFAKFPSAVIGPGAEIRWSRELTSQVDFEAELAVVIGKTARHVSESEALSCVFGYAAANDISARDLQYGDKQWTRGKSLDTFCPLGPALVTRDEITDPQNLKIRCRLNGRLVQDSSTAEMSFSVAQLISYCSRSFTLQPGDVLLTGTPNGVGFFRQPQLFLEDGDQVEVEIENIGRLGNSCRID